ncbi:MAG: iron ABC transporter permease [Candidatus Omnitrophica bacterium]|nr:iron ABC transporter permease [Candidatus Omnitrophota bacterium]
MKSKFLLLFLILILAVLLGIIKGSVNIPLGELFLKVNQPILMLRVFRIIVGIIAGMGLAVSGIVLQAILRNCLAEPYLLGTSSGAGLGAVLAIVMGIAGVYLPLMAFIGAILSVVLVYNLARENNKIPEQSLILSGVIVSVALSAIIIFLISISPTEALHGATWWLWGSLQVYDFKLLGIVTFIVLAGVAVIYIFSQDLNAISIGEEEALHLGVNIEIIKRVLIVVTSLITASVVCICGIIGFVGLMIPHMMRFVVGPNHKTLIPATCLAAAIFMVVCDTLSRTLFPPLEIPIGVITAILGAPVFIFLLKRRQKVR